MQSALSLQQRDALGLVLFSGLSFCRYVLILEVVPEMSSFDFFSQPREVLPPTMRA